MKSYKLHLRARAGRMLPHLQAGEAGARRFVGRKFDAELGHAFVDAQKQPQKSGGWPIVPEGETVLCEGPRAMEFCHEYAKAVRAGDVFAGDEETAKLCGVKFDPHAGDDEHEGDEPDDDEAA